MSELQKPIYRFGEFELDPDERRLLAHGQPVALTPKVFDTLVLLVEQAGHAVSKDELMHALWPRGFVDESNLTKQIWLIRKALGDAEHEARWIETVPKRGYRFVAPVTRTARASVIVSHGVPASNVADAASSSAVAGAERADSSAVSPSPVVDLWSSDRDAERRQLVASAETAAAVAPASSRTHALMATIVAVLVAFVVLIARHETTREASAPANNPPGTAVAIIAFNNLSQNSKDAWLGPALGEMLAMEITASGRVHALPDELVRPARADLAAPLAGGYAMQSLVTLRRRLGTDYVLSGSYLVSGSGDQPQLRLDLALQDARTGVEITSLARSGAVTDLPALVIQAGAVLREKLGIPSASSDELKQIASTQPPTAEVARRIGFALDALRRDDPARARDELLDAVAQAPGYAPAYSYLAQAWSALGYKAKALAAAQQAAAHDQDLPKQQRLEIETQVRKAEFKWPEAVESLRKLVALQSTDPEYRLQLIDALLAAGKPADATIVLEELRKLAGPIRNDPRVELAAARVASSRSDSKAQREHAQLALQEAQAREDAGLAADAEVQLGIARGELGKLDENEAQLREAIAGYYRISNPHGEAYARQNLANVLVERNKQEAAREEYQRAMATYQQIGDQGGVAAIYSNLARMLWTAGDRDGAETAARRSLEIRRETGDLGGQAWNLTALATIHSDEAASDEVVDEYTQAIALDERSGNRSHQVFLLTIYSDVLRQRGQLDEATKTCTQAETEAGTLADSSSIMTAVFQCALIALDRGEIDAATAGFERAQKIAKDINDPIQQSNTELSLAQIGMAHHRWAEARDRLQYAIDGFAKGENATGEAVAQSMIALCYHALGDTAARDRASARARDLRSRITERQEMFAADVSLAQLSGEIGQRDQAIKTLQALAADAEQRRWLANSLEARLIMVQLLEQAGDETAASPLRNALEVDAKRLGFKWILLRLNKQ